MLLPFAIISWYRLKVPNLITVVRNWEWVAGLRTSSLFPTIVQISFILSALTINGLEAGLLTMNSSNNTGSNVMLNHV